MRGYGKMSEESIGSVLIVEGGTAGWRTAAYFATAFMRQVQVALLESTAIPKIGVGEETIPNIQKVLFDFIEVPEEF
jgi:hypothetical protein